MICTEKKKIMEENLTFQNYKVLFTTKSIDT